MTSAYARVSMKFSSNAVRTIRDHVAGPVVCRAMKQRYKCFCINDFLAVFRNRESY